MSSTIIDPPAIVRSAVDVVAELSQADAEHEAGQQAERASLEHYRKAGEALLRAKAAAGHGQWLKVLKERTKIPPRQAQRYMELAKCDVTSHLPDEWRRISGNTLDELPPGGSLPLEDAADESISLSGDAFIPPDDGVQMGRIGLPTVKLGSKPGEVLTVDAWAALPMAKRQAVLATRGDARFNPQGDNENIEWALWSWNPVTGCLHNCPYCYARDIADLRYAPGFAPVLWPGRLTAPHNTPFPEAKAAEWVGHKNVFACSMGDLFGRWVPREWIDAVLAEVRAAPQWNFLFLTKFPVRMAEFDFPENAWLGTSVDCQARVANAERSFRKVRASVKWLSLEPLLEPLKFADLGAFNWVVIGGASRSSQTPEWVPPDSWVAAIKTEAYRLGVKVYEKSNIRKDRVRQYPGMDANPEPTEAPAALRYLPPPEGAA